MAIDSTSNPASVLREALNEPGVKARVCAALHVPETTEIDEESFQKAVDYYDELVEWRANNDA